MQEKYEKFDIQYPYIVNSQDEGIHDKQTT